MYIIKPYTYKQANKYGVIVCPSTKRDKKIDVFDEWGNYLCSAGARGYDDYPTYLEMERLGGVPKGYAKERRRLYRIRHSKEDKTFGSPSWASYYLLW